MQLEAILDMTALKIERYSMSTQSLVGNSLKLPQIISRFFQLRRYSISDSIT